MADEWGKAQILLEGIKSDVKGVADGYLDIKREMQEFRSEVNLRFDREVGDIKKIVMAHSGQLNRVENSVEEIKHDLKQHMHQSVPPAHIAV